VGGGAGRAACALADGGRFALPPPDFLIDCSGGLDLATAIGLTVRSARTSGTIARGGWMASGGGARGGAGVTGGAMASGASRPVSGPLLLTGFAEGVAASP